MRESRYVRRCVRRCVRRAPTRKNQMRARPEIQMAKFVQHNEQLTHVTR